VRSGADESAASTQDGRYSATGPLLFLSDYSQVKIHIYTIKPHRLEEIGHITKGVNIPFGMAIDRSGTLYVANHGGSVTEYLKGQTVPSLRITAGLDTPIDVAVDARGTLFVSDNARNTGKAAILEYLKGSKTPFAVIQDNLRDPFGIALDDQGNLYIADSDMNKILEVPRGHKHTQVLGYSGFSGPLGVAFDAGDNFYVSDSGAIEVYPPGQFTPSRTMSGGLMNPELMAFNRAQTLFVPNSGTDTVSVFPLGATTPSKVFTLPGVQPVAIAIAPPLRP
jgi:DNA-binding beta-propeller fold protein YncE